MRSSRINPMLVAKHRFHRSPCQLQTKAPSIVPIQHQNHHPNKHPLSDIHLLPTTPNPSNQNPRRQTWQNLLPINHIPRPSRPPLFLKPNLVLQKQPGKHHLHRGRSKRPSRTRLSSVPKMHVVLPDRDHGLLDRPVAPPERVEDLRVWIRDDRWVVAHGA